ncbi:MAG: glycosyl transferase family 1, partial [Myxococcales bacterium]|nr:glycosyl transferase family 1 [Myxococcales bacterium]
LARAVGTPAVMLFGPTPATAHPDDAARIQLSVEGLACRPCSAHGPRRCPRGHHACLDRLEPNDVMGGLHAALDRGSCGR